VELKVLTEEQDSVTGPIMHTVILRGVNDADNADEIEDGGSNWIGDCDLPVNHGAEWSEKNLLMRRIIPR
jgi:hypothetical protein